MSPRTGSLFHSARGLARFQRMKVPFHRVPFIMQSQHPAVAKASSGGLGLLIASLGRNSS